MSSSGEIGSAMCGAYPLNADARTSKSAHGNALQNSSNRSRLAASAHRLAPRSGNRGPYFRAHSGVARLGSPGSPGSCQVVAPGGRQDLALWALSATSLLKPVRTAGPKLLLGADRTEDRSPADLRAPREGRWS
jgi:hypothetical protein